MRFWYQSLGKLGGLFVLYTSKAFCFPLYLFDIIVHAVNMHYFYNKHVDQTVSIFFTEATVCYREVGVVSLWSVTRCRYSVCS